MPLFWDSSPTMREPRYIKSVFPTAVIAALLLDVPNARLQAILGRAIDFLEGEMLPDGTWSFFGADVDFPSDIDDTFFALAALEHFKFL